MPDAPSTETMAYMTKPVSAAALAGVIVEVLGGGKDVEPG